MRLLSPKVTYCYEILILLVLSVVAAHIYNQHVPEGLTWERMPIQPVEYAADGEVPVAKGIGTVGTEMVKRLVAEEGATFIDARYEEDFKAGHIPAAINIPPGMFADEAESLIGAPDDGRLLVIYCSSLTCRMSHDLGENLRMLGYMNMLIYEEGFRGWTEAQGEVEVEE